MVPDGISPQAPKWLTFFTVNYVSPTVNYLHLYMFYFFPIFQIACVSPLKCDSQETINTLRYACRAKRVRMNPVVQMVQYQQMATNVITMTFTAFFQNKLHLALGPTRVAYSQPETRSALTASGEQLSTAALSAYSRQFTG